MKSLFTLAALGVLCAVSYAQGARQSNDPDAQAVIGKSRAVLEAIKGKDAKSLGALLANDFRSIDLTGDFGGRQEMLGSAQEGFLKDFLLYNPQAFRIDNDSMLVSYNTAITPAEAFQEEMSEDNVVWPRYSKVSDLWVREGGEWKLKFEQTTPLRHID
ncbi:MAG TPA: nuclear transport factor 2 family protein [Terriglobales bacterium]|jgi:hypothetical protein